MTFSGSTVIQRTVASCDGLVVVIGKNWLLRNERGHLRLTRDSSGGGPGAIVNQDGTVNSPANPAARSMITIYATGAGMLSTFIPDGQLVASSALLPMVTVEAFIGEKFATVKYAGTPSGGILGLLQVNVSIAFRKTLPHFGPYRFKQFVEHRPVSL